MVLTNNDQLLHTGHLKGNEQLYIKNDSLVVIHQTDGCTLTLELGVIRCVYPITHNTLRIFWRAPKNTNQCRPWGRYQHDFKLDLKRSFPDRDKRRIAEKTESKRLATLMVHAIQKNHFVNQPNIKGYLAMHTDEYLMNFYEGHCKFGKGKMLVTNLGIYFIVDKKGLCMDIPLNLLDSYNHKNKTVKIYYFEPMWVDGYNTSSQKNRNIEIRIKSESAKSVCEGITKAYSDGGAKEQRTLATLTEEFGSMTPDELYHQYHAGRYGTFNPIYDYLAILAKRRWGTPTTNEVGKGDASVILACLCTATPIDVAGDLTEKDKKLRKDTLQYHKQLEEYNKQYKPLLADIMDIITKNLKKEDSQKIRTRCNPYIIFETIEQLASSGSISESFKPKSLVEWRRWKSNTNKKIIKQKLYNFPNGFDFVWIDDIFCPWSESDAKRITSEKDYSAILYTITLLNKKYDDNNIDKFMSSLVYAKTFERTQQDQIKLRVRRVYDEWCKSHQLPQCNTSTDKRWVVQYVMDNLNENNLEQRREHFNFEKTVIEELRDADIKSQNTKTRLERTIKPKEIPDKDIYLDAWYDESKHIWFTTNPYFGISQTKLEMMSPDTCEQKFGYRAVTFSKDVVEFRCGYPAIYDEEKKWWVLLCTISDDNITKEMIHNKNYNTLRYESLEPRITITNYGTFAYETEKEYFLKTLNDSVAGPLLPLNERVRRLLFTEISNCCVMVTREDKIQQALL